MIIYLMYDLTGHTLLYLNTRIVKHDYYVTM